MFTADYNAAQHEMKPQGCVLAPIFVGFFLGFVICLLICLCDSCHSQKSVTTSVAVDSTEMSATTEIGVTNSEATAMQNLSLHFDTLEMWLAPDISHYASFSPSDPDGNATAGMAVAQPSPSPPSVAPFNLTNLLPEQTGNGRMKPIYIKATGATMGKESAETHKNSETKIVQDTTSSAVGKKEDVKEDVDRTAVSKPPNMTWIIIAGFVTLALLIYFKK